MTPNFPNDNYPKNFQEIKYCFTCKDHLPISHLHKDVSVNETDEGMEVYKKYAKEPQYSPLGAAIESLRCDLHDLFMRVNDLQELRYNHDKIIEHMNARVKFLEEHHPRQIDENRKISRRVDELNQLLGACENNVYAIPIMLERLEKLEQAYKADAEAVKALIFDGARDRERLDRTEFNHNLRANDIVNLRNRLNEVTDTCVHNNSVLCKDFNKLELDLKNKDSDLWDRVIKLEQEKIIYKQNTIDDIHNRMTFIENNAASKENVADAFTQLRDNTNERLRILEQMHTENVYKPIESGKKPHKCPLCEGDGWDKKTMPYVGCEACGGKGILWG